MLVKQLFATMMERLNEIEAEYPNAESDRKQQLECELLELRHMSDMIIDHWLEFEEKMGQLAQHLLSKASDYGPLIAGDWQEGLYAGQDAAEHGTDSDSNTVGIISAELSHYFRQGQGYFDLNMYEQSIPHFARVVDEDPDLHVARLYLALGHFLAGQWDKAYTHLQLLLHTSDHPVFLALCHNTLGCILAKEGEEEQALQHFSRALDYFPRLDDAKFNKGKLLVETGQYQEGIKVLKELAAADDQDWEVMLLLSETYRKAGNDSAADQLLRRLAMATSHSDVLMKMASQYEENGQYQNAAVCYSTIVRKHPAKSWAWHGLGWNLWLHHPSKTCLSYIKKAISLEPGHLDYWFSYGWILQQLGEQQKAEQIFARLLKRNPRHTLTISALVVDYGKKGDLQKAEQLCEQLIDSQDPAVQGLGYHHLGRLAVIKGDYDSALPLFNRSIQFTGNQIKENYLYQGLCHFFLGDKKEAVSNWEHIF